MVDVPVYDTAGSTTDPSMESKPMRLQAPEPDVLTPAIYATGDDDGGPGPVAAPLYAVASGPGPTNRTGSYANALDPMEPETETEIEDGAEDAYLGIGDGAGDSRRSSASPTIVPVLYDTAEPDFNSRPGSIFVDASNSIRLKSVVRKNPLATMGREVAEEDFEDEAQMAGDAFGLFGRSRSYDNALDTMEPETETETEIEGDC